MSSPAIRPVIHINQSDMKAGDKVLVGNTIFTTVDSESALADADIGFWSLDFDEEDMEPIDESEDNLWEDNEFDELEFSAFDFRYETAIANNKSDIQGYIDEWFAGI